MISSPVGTARDVLPDECLFNSVDAAVELLEKAARSNELRRLCATAAEKAAVTHSPSAVARALQSAYADLSKGAPSIVDTFASLFHSVSGQIAANRTVDVKNPRIRISVPAVSAQCLDSRNCRSREDLHAFASQIAELRHS